MTLRLLSGFVLLFVVGADVGKMFEVKTWDVEMVWGWSSRSRCNCGSHEVEWVLWEEVWTEPPIPGALGPKLIPWWGGMLRGSGAPPGEMGECWSLWWGGGGGWPWWWGELMWSWVPCIEDTGGLMCRWWREGGGELLLSCCDDKVGCWWWDLCCCWWWVPTIDASDVGLWWSGSGGDVVLAVVTVVAVAAAAATAPSNAIDEVPMWGPPPPLGWLRAAAHFFKWIFILYLNLKNFPQPGQTAGLRDGQCMYWWGAL